MKLSIRPRLNLCVPPTEKSSSDSSARTRLWVRTRARNLRDHLLQAASQAIVAICE